MGRVHYYNNDLYVPKRRRNVVATSTALLIGAAVVVVAGTTATVMSAQANNDQKRAAKNAAEDATNRAKALDAAAKKADLDSITKSKEDARKRLASMTETNFTSPLGTTSDAPTQTTKLGSNG